MLARNGLDPQEALVCTMVLVAAAGSSISDRAIGVMSGLVQTLPAFRDFSALRLEVATTAAIDLLREDDGLQHAATMIRTALEPRLRETAYTLACDVIAANGFAEQESLRLLAFLRDELYLDQLAATAIERAARARYQVV